MFQQKHLAQNIRKYRILHNLTQAQLAQKLYVTPQNVSKWETGRSVPDLENLFMLAQVLCTSTDRLLGRGQPSIDGRILVAIDGGGTKTEFILFTEHGQILKRLHLSGSNPNTVGLEKAQAVLKAGLEQLMAVSGDISAVYAGIAGCGSPQNKAAMQTHLKRACPEAVCSVSSDILNVINSTPQKDRCIAAICGTGSVVYAKTPSQMHRVGGWGPLWESGCSGYDLGRDALLAAMRHRDGLSSATVLTELVEDILGGNVWDHIHTLYDLSTDDIAAYARTVFQACRQGDAIADEILQKNTRQLAKLINTAAKRYDCGTKVVLSGGLLAQKDLLLPYLCRELDPELTLIPCTHPQICGAAAVSCQLLGIQNPEFDDIFYNNYLQAIKEDTYAENRNA